MRYTKLKDMIVITDKTEFNIRQILDCGQIFRYVVNGNLAVVISTNHIAEITEFADRIEIFTEDVDYFVNFFDLDNDYNKIKKELVKDEFLRPCCEYGYGIRILKQDFFEMLVSFIISANNNIKRIKNSVNFLSKKFGTKIKLGKSISFIENDLIECENGNKYYYAFPTLEQLKRASVKDYVEAGLGYRAEQLYDTIQKLNQDVIFDFKNMTTEDKYKFLLSLKGVGEKVANCIMLFSESVMSSFPVDTWINKVYNNLTNTNCNNRKEIEKILKNKYKNYSGYAQQYFFYYYRENKINNNI